MARQNAESGGAPSGQPETNEVLNEANTKQPRSRADPLPGAKIPLLVHLSQEAHDKLARHTQSGIWTADAITEVLIRDGLHATFLAIRYRGILIAEAGLFRSFDRRSLRPYLLLKSTLGSYRITPRPGNEEYLRWLAVYEKRGLPDAADKAAEMSVFLLKEQLEKVNEKDTKHIIYPEDFLVEQFI